MFEKKGHKSDKAEHAEKHEKEQAEEAAEKSKASAKKTEAVESDIHAAIEKLKDLREQNPNVSIYKQAVSHLTDALTILGRLK